MEVSQILVKQEPLMNKVITFLIIFSTSVNADTLSDYLQKVRASNLELKSIPLSISATEARSHGLTLKAPMIGVSQMRNLQGISYAFEFQQEIPFPSRLSKDKKSREISHDLNVVESDHFSQEKILEAQLAFVRYWKNFQQLKYAKEYEGWLRQHRKFTQSVARSDPAATVYSQEIESALGLAISDQTAIQMTLENEKLSLRLLAFDPSYDPETPILGEPIPFHENDELSRSAVINQSRSSLATSDLEVARTSYLPNLYFRARKLDRPMIGMANQEIMLGIDLPFAYFWGPKADVAEAVAKKSIAEAEYRKAVVESEALRASLKAKAELLLSQIKILETVSLPAIEKGLKYAKNISFRELNSLQTHRKAFEDYIQLQNKLVESRLAYEELSAQWYLQFHKGGQK
jgi:hypothetical protein